MTSAKRDSARRDLAAPTGETLRKSGQKKEACEHYHTYMELSGPSSPDRKEALKAQTDLGCAEGQ